MPVFNHNSWVYATERSIDIVHAMSIDKIGSNSWTKEFWDKLDFVPSVVFFRVLGNTWVPGCIAWMKDNCEERFMVMHKDVETLHMYLFESDTDAMKFKLAWGDV
jgi:hypothetical protein